MAGAERKPSSLHVLRAITARELRLAWRRRLLKLLFLASVLPPVIFITVILVRLFVERSFGADLDWDPMLRFLQFQAGPVTLLALGIGTPCVARDRAEDVLFLYATRPVVPWHYALGKLAAVALPAAALMLLPGLLIAVLRLTVTQDLGAAGAGLLLLKMILVSLVMGWAYAGLTVGASSGVKRARWAMLLAIAFLVFPDMVAQLVTFGRAWPMGPGSAVNRLMESLFDLGLDGQGLWCLALLMLYGAGGAWVSVQRAQREMIP
ncbi:MAG: hypothetical protein JW819_02195 [Candidatus Krumholzibacteriota bacterium]|nr:hypothetical protein [Candidatus Krumholzibacteriota bacterium]